MAIFVHKRVPRWGNGLGIRLTKKDAEKLGVKAGDEIQAEVFGNEDMPSQDAVDRLAVVHLGGDGDLEEDLDRLAEDDALEDLSRSADEDARGDP